MDSTENKKPGSEAVVREITRRTKKKYNTEEKIRIVYRFKALRTKIG